jgi:hypothetical protein
MGDVRRVHRGGHDVPLLHRVHGEREDGGFMRLQELIHLHSASAMRPRYQCKRHTSPVSGSIVFSVLSVEETMIRQGYVAR